MLSGNTLKITNFFRYTTQNKQAKFIKSITPFSFFQRRGECSSCSSLDLEIGFSRKKEIIKSKIGEYSSHLFFSSGKDNWDKDYPQNEEKSVQLFFDSIREYNASNPIPTASVKMVGSNKESEKGGHFEFISFPSQKKLYIAQSEDTAQTTNKFKSILTYLKTQNPKKLKEIDASEDIPENEYYIMICCHQQMDKRCGYCGNFLVDEFKNKIANYSDCNKKVSILKTTHVGGHKFAGNVLVFPPGDWFGNVTPINVENILDYYLKLSDPKSLKEFYRGSMSSSIPEISE